MKYLFSVSLLSLCLFVATSCSAQGDKAKRVSPPATAKETIGNLTISIDYSQPSVKGRTIGVDLEPKDKEVWRAGANEATVFEVNQDVKIEGQALPKGKYALFILTNGYEWTLILNKTAKQWGAFKYNEADDALRVPLKAQDANPFAEKLTFTIDQKGTVILVWGSKRVDFMVQQ